MTDPETLKGLRKRKERVLLEVQYDPQAPVLAHCSACGGVQLCWRRKEVHEVIIFHNQDVFEKEMKQAFVFYCRACLPVEEGSSAGK